MFEQYLNNPNVRAFLDLIAYCEGANYNTVFGGGTFTGNQHPERIVRAGGYSSDAAGRYQFLSATYPNTWRRVKRQYGLPDFSPRSQDLGAIALINEKGAISNLLAGDLDGAVAKVRGVWPSLPGGRQQTRTWAQARTWYNGALAVYRNGAPASTSRAAAAADDTFGASPAPDPSTSSWSPTKIAAGCTIALFIISLR